MPHQIQKSETETLFLVEGGSIVESLIGVFAVVLAILGIIGFSPVVLLSISAMVLGAALFSKGMAVGVRARDIVAHSSGGKLLPNEVRFASTADSIGGIAGIVLGLLSLLGLIPFVLIPVAAIAYGVSLMVGSRLDNRINYYGVLASVHSTPAQRVAEEAVIGSSDMEFFAGIAGIVLGILALVTKDTLSLALIAMLTVGAILSLTGSSFLGRLVSVFRKA